MKWAGAEPMEDDCEMGLCPSCQDSCLEIGMVVRAPNWKGDYVHLRCRCGYSAGDFMPDFTPEETDRILRDAGYDPEQLGRDFAAFVREVSVNSPLGKSDG